MIDILTNGDDPTPAEVVAQQWDRLSPETRAELRRRMDDPEDPTRALLAQLREQLDEANRAPMIHLCGSGRASVGPSPKARIYPYACPFCDGGELVAGPDPEPCLHCHGTGVTDDVKGWNPDLIKRVPRPPAVMKSPCVDCAYRPGSPESATGIAPGADTPFYCHHGMIRQGDGYVATATVGTLPLGAMVCASWWDMATGGELPTTPFRDPGGADRSEDAPELPAGDTPTPAFRCPACTRTSYHPQDVATGYCGTCHDFTGEPA